MEKLEVLATVTGFASLCGALNYLLGVVEGKRFSWPEFILHSMISAICGVITFELLSSYGVCHDAAGALCGLSGWMGTRFLRLLETYFSKKVDGEVVQK